MPADLYPALRTHLREHYGDLALLAPHGLATDLPQVLASKSKPGIWFHDLPALSTLRGTIAAVDAGTTPAGMAMVGVAQSGLEAYQTHVASGVGTFQEGQAMILLRTSTCWRNSQGYFGWYQTTRRQWEPSGHIRKEAIVGMAYTTSTPRT